MWYKKLKVFYALLIQVWRKWVENFGTFLKNIVMVVNFFTLETSQIIFLPLLMAIFNVIIYLISQNFAYPQSLQGTCEKCWSRNDRPALLRLCIWLGWPPLLTVEMCAAPGIRTQGFISEPRSDMKHFYLSSVRLFNKL